MKLPTILLRSRVWVPVSVVACGCSDGTTVTSDSAIEILVEPHQSALLRIEGPVSRSATTDEIVYTDCSVAGCLDGTGRAFVDDLPAGEYTVSFDESYRAHRIIATPETVAVDVREGRTAKVRFIALEDGGTLTLGDTMSGRELGDRAVRLLVDVNDTIIIRESFGPSYYFYGRFPTLRVYAGGRPMPRLGYDRYWILNGEREYVLFFTISGDIRGEMPQWWGLATGLAGAIVQLSQSEAEEGPWGATVEDTVWIRNIGIGAVDWRGTTEDPAVSFDPPEGTLLPAGQRAILIRTDAGDLRGEHSSEVMFEFEGDPAPFVEEDSAGFPRRYYDPSYSLVYEPKELEEIAGVHPDGSVLLTTLSSLYSVDLESDAVTQLLQAPLIQWAVAGPDSVIYVTSLRSHGNDLWRIRPDGTRDLLVEASRHAQALGYVREFGPGPDSSALVQSDSALWRVAPGEEPQLLYEAARSWGHLVFDPSSGLVYFNEGETLGTFDLSDSTLTSLGNAPSTPLELALGRSGRLYTVLNGSEGRYATSFDPSEGTWGGETISPFVSGVAVLEGYLMFLGPYGVYRVPVDDGPVR